MRQHEYYVLIKYKEFRAMKPKFIMAKSKKQAKRKVKKYLDGECSCKIRQIA